MELTSGPGDGGQAAPPCRTLLIHPDGSEEEIPSKKVLTIRAGDVLRVWTSGGGGYGDPTKRDPELVLSDVLDGFTSVELAERDYAVVIDAETMTIDAEATSRARAERAATAVPSRVP